PLEVLAHEVGGIGMGRAREEHGDHESRVAHAPALTPGHAPPKKSAREIREAVDAGGVPVGEGDLHAVVAHELDAGHADLGRDGPGVEERGPGQLMDAMGAAAGDAEVARAVGGLVALVPDDGHAVPAQPDDLDRQRHVGYFTDMSGRREALTQARRRAPITTWGEGGEALGRALDVGDQGITSFTHRFHSYPARLHPHTARRALAALALPPGARVLDPFCGSGTVLVEAVRAGLAASGLDASPLAVLVARAKTA